MDEVGTETNGCDESMRVGISCPRISHRLQTALVKPLPSHVCRSFKHLRQLCCLLQKSCPGCPQRGPKTTSSTPSAPPPAPPLRCTAPRSRSRVAAAAARRAASSNCWMQRTASSSASARERCSATRACAPPAAHNDSRDAHMNGGPAGATTHAPTSNASKRTERLLPLPRLQLRSVLRILPLLHHRCCAGFASGLRCRGRAAAAHELAAV